ncbi:class I SAM-dependent methyltransferase [Sphingomonas sp. 1P06PA]|uniref:methyltransferase domain-containing protein n=1 Tax=Sphingomonas sp. 1P06PA TaxID=554121 RepID=UPI0039A6D1EE
MTDAPIATAYDRIAYPTAIFAQTTPDRMAVLAALHGLRAPPIETARVLEIGGGDGMNLLALGVAWPETRLLSFDLAPSAVARGRKWAELAGIRNVEIAQMDILDAAAGAIDGEYDYVIAHGVYAWVPDAVREATMALIGRVLAPDGVAFISYNAKPGGWLRLAIRDMLQHELAGIDDTELRIVRARAFLSEFAQAPEEKEEGVVAVMRQLCRAMLDRPDEVLIHDELGDCYHPQTLSEVAAAAAANDLEWLGEAANEAIDQSFLPDEVEDVPGAVLRRAQSADYEEGRYFRSSLFVRAGRNPARRFDPRRLSALHAASRAQRRPEGDYVIDDSVFELRDAELDQAMQRITAAWPARIAVADLFDDPDRLHALSRMFDAGFLGLHMTPGRYTLAPGERPVASPLARVQIAHGFPAIASLDHRTVAMEDVRARAFIQLLDGSRDRATLAAEWAASEHGADIPLDSALRLTAAGAVLMA